MVRTIFDSPLLQPLFHRFADFLLFIAGWKPVGEVPDLKKMVLIGAPHTSNWDFLIFLLIIFKLKLSVHWMGKHTMFRWPVKGLLKRIGGIPVDRSQAGGVVESMIQIFNRSERLIITIAPSGTRKKVSKWKTGFYHIAYGAHIPIVCGFIDYKNKCAGFGPTVVPSGDLETDMARILSFYAEAGHALNP